MATELSKDTAASTLLLLGMHRSGTSALVNFLSDLGLRGPNDPLPAAPDNPDGYGESLAIINANTAILTKHGGTWDAPPVPSDVDGDDVEKASGAYGSAYGEVRGLPQVLKDPRLCVLLPTWRAALGGGPLRAIVLFRHPDRVVASLLHHNRGESQLTASLHANALWERYNRAMLENLNTNDEVLFCDFDALVNNLAYRATWLKRLALFLPALLEHDEASLTGAFAARFSPSTKSGSSPESVATPQQLLLYGELVAMAKTNVQAALMTKETPGLDAVFSLVHGTKVTIPALKNELSLTAKSLEEQTEARHYLERYSAGQQLRIEALDDQIAQMEHTLSWRLTEPLRKVQQRRRQGS